MNIMKMRKMNSNKIFSKRLNNPAKFKIIKCEYRIFEKKFFSKTLHKST